MQDYDWSHFKFMNTILIHPACCSAILLFTLLATLPSSDRFVLLIPLSSTLQNLLPSSGTQLMTLLLILLRILKPSEDNILLFPLPHLPIYLIPLYCVCHSPCHPWWNGSVPSVRALSSTPSTTRGLSPCSNSPFHLHSLILLFPGLFLSTTNTLSVFLNCCLTHIHIKPHFSTPFLVILLKRDVSAGCPRLLTRPFLLSQLSLGQCVARLVPTLSLHVTLSFNNMTQETTPSSLRQCFSYRDKKY